VTSAAVKPATGRDAAFDIRVQVERGRRIDVALGAAVRGLEPRERAFAHELTYGTTRMRGRLDHLLSRHVHKGLESVRADVLEVLRLGAYQILYMGSVPAYAAVSASVDRADALRGKGAAGLVNAVLRRVAEDGASMDLFPKWADDPAGHLSTWGSHPRWLLDRWLSRWSAAEVYSLVESNNERPPTFLNSLNLDAEAAAEVLAAAGIRAHSVGEVVGSLELSPEVSPVEALAALPASIVQDPAAQLVVRYMDIDPGTKVADLCAAPGGKALAVSVGASYTLAADRSESRIRMVRENANRTGSRVGCVVADAAHPPLAHVDVVLVDVPCTGTGTLARHPDARWRLGPESVTELAAVQEHLLDSAAVAVASGGLLVYSTCTLEPEENEERIDHFLQMHPDFSIEESQAVPPAFLNDRGCLSVLPQQSGFDGSFAARMRRSA
jgi:16S rRNA (cytosine967-C5)-methyltransferase